MLRTFLLISSILLLVSCSDPVGEKFQTAQFEEQQFNKLHAIELYQEIIRQSPESEFAAKSRLRLKELTAGQ